MPEPFTKSLTVFDASSDMDGDAADVVAADFALAGVLDDTTAPARNLRAGRFIVALKHFAPGVVAEFRRVPRGVDDVGEQHRGENPVGDVLVTLSGQELLDLTGY